MANKLKIVTAIISFRLQIGKLRCGGAKTHPLDQMPCWAGSATDMSQGVSAAPLPASAGWPPDSYGSVAPPGSPPQPLSFPACLF